MYLDASGGAPCLATGLSIFLHPNPNLTRTPTWGAGAAPQTPGGGATMLEYVLGFWRCLSSLAKPGNMVVKAHRDLWQRRSACLGLEALTGSYWHSYRNVNNTKKCFRRQSSSA
jgi:hypothetical protein